MRQREREVVTVAIDEVVVDTNVFVHANNTGVTFCASAREALCNIDQQGIIICLDDEFDIVESRNRSWIGSEYFKHIRIGTFGYAILLKIIMRGNIRQIFKDKYLRFKRQFRQIVRDNVDICFLLVALGCASHILVSNDFEDFQQPKRSKIRKQYGISIISSREFQTV